MLAALNVRYNDLKEYCSDLCTAMSTPVPEFEELGVKVGCLEVIGSNSYASVQRWVW